MCAAANAIPTATMVIMNWRSTAPPCSEMDSGNHQCLLTNIPTEPSVMSQITSPRTRPIRVSPSCHRLSVCVHTKHRLTSVPLLIDLRPSHQTAKAGRARKQATTGAHAGSILKAPRECCWPETKDPEPGRQRDKTFLRFPGTTEANLPEPALTSTE